MKRTRYDDVEDMAMRAMRVGHDFKLYFRHTGMLHLFHNGEEVLVDGPRDYSAALDKIKELMWHTSPSLPGKDLVSEKDVRRGKATKPKAKGKAKAKAKGRGK